MEVLRRSLEEVVQRHEPLRTTYELVDGQLVQVVVPPPSPFTLAEVDLTSLPGEERAGEVERLVAAASSRPFDLVVGPLFELILVRLADDDHVVVIRIHHSVFDDWSVGPFRRELSVLYAAFPRRGGPTPAEPATTFTDVAGAQREALAGGKAGAELDWWARHLSAAPVALQLPVANPDAPPGRPSTPADPVTLELAAPLVEQLRAFARRHRATPFITMLAAFCLLARAETDHDDLVLASVVANRDRTDLECLIGCFTKKVLLRVRLDDDPSFAALVTRVRTVLLDALAHQDLPYEAVVQGGLGPAAAVHGLVPTIAVVLPGRDPPGRAVAWSCPNSPRPAWRPPHPRPGPLRRERRRRQVARARDAWGSGLYLSTFVIFSVAEGDRGVRLVTRGAFHGPSVQRLLRRYEQLLADASIGQRRWAANLPPPVPPPTTTPSAPTGPICSGSVCASATSSRPSARHRVWPRRQRRWS